MITSITIWIIGGVFAILLFIIKIVDYYATKKHDANIIKAYHREGKFLSGQIRDQTNQITEFVKHNNERFISVVERLNDQNASRDAAVIAVLNTMRDQIKTNQKLNVKVFDLINSDKGWGLKIEEIMKLLSRVQNFVILIKDVNKEIQHSSEDIKERLNIIEGIIKNKLGNRFDDES